MQRVIQMRPAEGREGAPSHQSGIVEIEMKVTMQINMEIEANGGVQIIVTMDVMEVRIGRKT
jgi:hypothetical protein